MGFRRVLSILVMPFAVFAVVVLAFIAVILILFGFERCSICKERVGPFQWFVIYDDFEDLAVAHRSCYHRLWGDDEVG